MKQTEWNQAMNQIDNDLVENYVKQQTSYVHRKLWLRVGALAACFAVIVGGVLAFVITRDNKGAMGTIPELPGYTPIIFNALENAQQLSGNGFEFLVGSGQGSSEAQAPPPFRFSIESLTVKAKVSYNYPDVYYKLDVDSEYKPKPYRLIQMEVLEVIHGENVPQYILYLIPEGFYVDMSIYDCLIISMKQIGIPNYVLRNGTQNQIEACAYPIFADFEDRPNYGSVIAFSNNVFDESLWQHWRSGSYVLNNPESSHYVLKRGDTLDTVEGNLEALIEEYKEYSAENYRVPTLISTDFKTQEAREAIEYVKPFENGVFAQTYEPYRKNGQLIFKRFINGCQTEETITIDLKTHEVTYSEVRYTKEELSRLDNIAVHLSELAKEYQEQTPTPPHIDPSDKTIMQLSLYAWYAKVNGKIYGVVKTTWRYRKLENNICYEYYDEAYILYDMSDMTAGNIEKEDLIALLGQRNIYRGELGKEEGVPFE